MGKKKTEANGRAGVSRERRIALALRAVLDASLEDGATLTVAQMEAGEAAYKLLADLGYGDLLGIPKRTAQLNALLQDALRAGDGKEISRLGLELDRAKAGREPGKSIVPVAKPKSSRKRGAAATPSTETEKDGVSDVEGNNTESSTVE